MQLRFIIEGSSWSIDKSVVANLDTTTVNSAIWRDVETCDVFWCDHIIMEDKGSESATE